MNAKHPALWLCVVALAGFIVGAAWPPPPVPRAAADTAAWSIPGPDRITRYSPETFAKITRDMRWSGGAVAADGSATEWRLAGILISPEPAILVMDPQSPGKAKRIAIGEQLPDGSTLRVIDGDKIATQLDSCERTYQLYQLKATSASTGCGVEPTPEASDKETST